jgi:hypothetical protein
MLTISSVLIPEIIEKINSQLPPEIRVFGTNLFE